jgi:small ligand-binding sensory domain FIST
MRFSAAITTKTEAREAVEDLAQQVNGHLGYGKADLALLFAHSHFIPEIDNVVASIRGLTGARRLIGCTGAGIIGVRKEVEQLPALSLLAAELPGVKVTPFRVGESDLEEAAGPGYWHFQLDVPPETNPNFVLFGDPFSIPVVRLVEELTNAYPGAPMVGALASGSGETGDNRLILDNTVYTDGAVGVALSGAVVLRTLVAQSCRPIGEPLVVTRADKNIILELAGQPPLAVLKDLLPNLPANDQELARTSLLLGCVINEYKEDFKRGDFLVRGLIGTDPRSGALIVGDWVRPGQTVQFQVRDAEIADKDLRHWLDSEQSRRAGAMARGGLLFSCLGRGERMYGVPNHDIGVIRQMIGGVPLAGFFGNGEIGLVGDRAFVHGFTSVLGLFAEAQD